MGKSVIFLISLGLVRMCSHSPAVLPDSVGDPGNGRIQVAATPLPWQGSWGCYLVSTLQRPAAALRKTL